MGMLSAYAGMLAGKCSTFFPAYGIAMRGGTANCTVIISDNEIASPIVSDPNVMVVMNELSLDHFEPMVSTDGTLFVNESLVNKKVGRSDVNDVYIKATGIALEKGDGRMANMAMLGGVLKATGMLPLETFFEAMEKTFPPKIKHLVGKNREVMQQGFDSVT
jgi:2-oxoglutarate ferredoxin oxidoreductase subunit gamma